MQNKTITLPIDQPLDGRKIRYILRNHLGFSAALTKRLKDTEDGILLNGSSAQTDRQVHTGDVLVLTLRDDNSAHIEPRELPLDILYEDEDIIAVNKPPGMPSHPSQNHHHDTLANGLMYYFRNRSFTVRVITRLDRETSGVVLVAKHSLAAQRLSDAMQAQKIDKEYIAAVNGKPNPERGRISAPIARQEGSVILRCVARNGKEAVTDYETIETKNGRSLVRLQPRTGRTHQLRVHMSHIGTPIYGDDLYGARQMGERTRLHCGSISFSHPMTGEPISIVAPIPEDITTLFL